MAQCSRGFKIVKADDQGAELFGQAVTQSVVSQVEVLRLLKITARKPSGTGTQPRIALARSRKWPALLGWPHPIAGKMSKASPMCVSTTTIRHAQPNNSQDQPTR